MGSAYTNRIGNVGELTAANCLQDRSNGDTHSSRLASSHDLAAACDIVSSPGSVMTCDTRSLHLATSPDSVMTSGVHTPHPTSPAVMASESIESLCDVGSPHFVTSRKAVMQKNMPLNVAKLHGQVGGHLLCYTTDRNINASDVSSDMRPRSVKPNNRGDVSLSPASECIRHVVTRAGSKCSMRDSDDDGLGMWSEQDLRLAAEVLAAECSLLEVQDELDLRISTAERVKLDKVVQMRQLVHFNTSDVNYEKGSCASKGIHNDQAKGIPQGSFAGTKGMLCSSSNFAREHLRRLHDIPSERTTIGPQEDLTFALQGRLQDLLLVARVSDLEQEEEVHASAQLESNNPRDDFDWCEDGVTGMLGRKSIKSLLEDKRRATEAAPLRKEPSLLSWERAKVKEAHPFQNNDTCFRRQTQQTVAEEMYCKETIRRLVHQMQAEIEQWSQMQDILYKLQEELDGLNSTQRFWEERAHRAEAQLLSLQEELHGWRCQARSSQEELVMLRCERQILKNRIEMMEDAPLCFSSVVDSRLKEEPRCSNVGAQHEEFAPCESFVHSRNESGRSSVDLGTSSQRSFRKSIKKSMSFANNKENINTNKFRFGKLGMPTRAEPTGLELSSKKVDVGSKGMLKNPKPLAHFMNINAAKSVEHSNGQERKKARLFAFKDKSTNASNASDFPFDSKNMKDGLLVGHADNGSQDYTVIDTLWSLKSKSSLPCAPTSTPLPSAPASTPSRVLFGNIVNITKH